MIYMLLIIAFDSFEVDIRKGFMYLSKRYFAPENVSMSNELQHSEN